jgi:hypothetical protein
LSEEDKDLDLGEYGSIKGVIRERKPSPRKAEKEEKEEEPQGAPPTIYDQVTEEEIKVR